MFTGICVCQGFQKLEGKAEVRVVCMDLATSYRSLVRLYFPNARIVVDRFHLIRLINHHFLDCWREIDPAGSKNHGLLSLMRRHRHNLRPDQQFRLSAYLEKHPAWELIYRFKVAIHVTTPTSTVNVSLQLTELYGGRAGTRTPDLLRVKKQHLFQKRYQFYPPVLVFSYLGNLLRSQMNVAGPIAGRVLAQFRHRTSSVLPVRF